MAYDGPKRPPRAKNILDFRKLSLTAPCPSAEGQTSSLVFGLISSNPRLTVYTNDPNEKTESTNYGKITAELNLPVFFSFLELLRKAIASPGEWSTRIENKNYIFPGGKRSERPVLKSILHVGKDKDGCVWMSVTAKDRPKIKFIFGSDHFHAFIHADGTPYTNAETSLLVAAANIEMLYGIVNHLAVTTYVEPPPRDQNGGNGNGNRGGYGGGNRNGGGGNAPPDDFDNDIPF